MPWLDVDTGQWKDDEGCVIAESNRSFDSEDEGGPDITPTRSAIEEAEEGSKEEEDDGSSEVGLDKKQERGGGQEDGEKTGAEQQDQSQRKHAKSVAGPIQAISVSTARRAGI